MSTPQPGAPAEVSPLHVRLIPGGKNSPANWLEFIFAATLLAATPLFAQSPDEREVEALDAAAPVAAAPVAATVQPAAKAGTQPALALEVPARAAANRRSTNLFASHSWYTPPPPREQVQPVEQPQAPTAPPLPFAYLGRLQQGDVTVYFLAHDNRAYDAKLGDVLDNTYSVDGVSNGHLMFTYLPLKTRQGLQIGE